MQPHDNAPPAAAGDGLRHRHREPHPIYASIHGHAVATVTIGSEARKGSNMIVEAAPTETVQRLVPDYQSTFPIRVLL